MKTIASTLFALVPSKKALADALVMGALTEVGSAIVKESGVNVSTVLGLAKDVGLELIGQKPLPGAQSADAPDGAAPLGGASAEGKKDSNKVPLAPRPAKRVEAPQGI